MTKDQIIELLARMSTPEDEYPNRGIEGETLDDYVDDLSSDRMEDDTRALWRLIDEARKATA